MTKVMEKTIPKTYNILYLLTASIMRYQSLLNVKVQTLYLTVSHDVSYRAYPKSRITTHHFDFDFD